MLSTIVKNVHEASQIASKENAIRVRETSDANMRDRSLQITHICGQNHYKRPFNYEEKPRVTVILTVSMIGRINCASPQLFYWGRLTISGVMLFLSLQQTAIAQCEQVICPPVNCLNPLRFSGECCAICLQPPSKKSDCVPRNAVSTLYNQSCIHG